MKRIVIIGNGIAGITAARYLRKQSNFPVTVVSAESKYFFSRTALMYVYMGHMRQEDIQPYENWFWEKNDIQLIQAWVQTVNSQDKCIHLSNGKTIIFDILIIACGSTYNKFGWPGQDSNGVTGLYSLQDLEYIESVTNRTQRAVIVGGGLIGIELAEMLQSRKKEVIMLVRENSYWDNVLPKEESQMINRHIQAHHIDLRLQTELKEIKSDATGRVSSVVTTDNEEISCQFVGLTAGVKPNTGFLADSGIELNKGVLVDEYFQTNIPNIYAIGDCAEFRNPLSGRSRIEQVWYTGKMHGETVAQTITGSPTKYTPGVWFNSAKFLDIEYQVYGVIPNQLPAEVETLFWEHDSGTHSIRINFEKVSHVVTGFNLMGIRYRHEVCEKWLTEKRTIEHVLEHLSAANFDPEFFRRHEGEIIQLYNTRYPHRAVKPRARRSLSHLIFGS